MDPKLNEEITDAVRQWARPTTPDDLKARGVQKVRSVSLARMIAMIEKAVNRTLIARTLGKIDEGIDHFSSATRNEFMRMMNDDPQRGLGGTEFRERKHTELARLKHELAGRREAVRAHEARLDEEEGVHPERDQVLEEGLKLLIRERQHEPDLLEQEIVEFSIGAVREERDRVQRARLKEHHAEIDRLERRMAKVNGKLKDTEAELARLIDLGELDPGLASIYTTVQGLKDSDELSSKKSDLMAAIFEANLELR